MVPLKTNTTINIKYFFQKTLHVHRFLFLLVYVDLPPVCDQRNEVLEDRSATWIEEHQKWMDLSIQHAETIRYRCCWPVEIPIEIRVSALIMFATWINHQRWGWKHQKRHGLILKSHGTTMKKPRIFSGNQLWPIARFQRFWLETVFTTLAFMELATIPSFKTCQWRLRGKSYQSNPWMIHPDFKAQKLQTQGSVFEEEIDLYIVTIV